MLPSKRKKQQREKRKTRKNDWSLVV